MLTSEPLPSDEASSWVSVPSCGAVCSFVGTVRDHADGRADVVGIDYEAYEEQVVPVFRAIAGELRARWPELGRVAIWHRVGRLVVGEASVVVAASAPHRAEAFAACRLGIDTLKATAPIWKKETWADGSDWSSTAAPVSVPARAAHRSGVAATGTGRGAVG